MLVMTCDRCGVGISRSQKDAVVRLKIGGGELRADLCEVCQKVVKTDIAVELARWKTDRELAELAESEQAQARLLSRGVAAPSRTREPSRG